MSDSKGPCETLISLLASARSLRGYSPTTSNLSLRGLSLRSTELSAGAGVRGACLHVLSKGETTPDDPPDEVAAAKTRLRASEAPFPLQEERAEPWVRVWLVGTAEHF